jgi:phosphonate metabolism-associated iron-containing alcohol dehydrogenase
MWTYLNPVSIHFGAGIFEQLPRLIGGRRYALVTYPEPPFQELANRLGALAGEPVLTISDIAPNPDYQLLARQTARFANVSAEPEVIVALGGGSVIDSAKVFAYGNGNFDNVAKFLEGKQDAENLSQIPIIAVPTTAGTGSEVTCWATVWHEEKCKKYSFSRECLYPEAALIDPELMLGKPYGLTLATGLDALSHSIESIWNVNANPVSARHAVAAARTIIEDLPRLSADLGNLDLRSNIAEASLNAGLAFSNTKTAIAHNLSYPITLEWGVQHGIACSFTLPTLLRSVIGIGGFREAALKEIFGEDLDKGADALSTLLEEFGIGLRFSDHGVPAERCQSIIEDAFDGERGKNFAGSKERFIEVAEMQNII